MNGALILDRLLDGESQAKVRQAAERAGLRQAAPGERPQVVVAGLAPGERNLPSAVAAAAEPGLPVILLSQDALVQPVVLLAGGRLLLVPAHVDVEALAEHLRLVTRPGQPPPRAQVHLRSRRWAATRIGESSLVGTEGSLSGVIAAASLAAVARDVAHIAGVGDPATAAKLLPGVLAKGGAWAAAAVLDPGHGQWTLAWIGATSLLVAAPLRLPAVWRPVAPAAGATGRVLEAQRGDVVLLSGPLPGDPAFADAALGAAAHQGCSVLIGHLVEHGDRLGIPIDALVVEVL
ncbi:hypothetical protein LBMAG53_06790 [Planctomycetota bacterium]|nr:hypothetical protein LBMAG53_06790 [Planctomycetota bacterium]